jgi:hypothetical protein
MVSPVIGYKSTQTRNRGTCEGIWSYSPYFLVGIISRKKQMIFLVVTKIFSRIWLDRIFALKLKDYRGSSLNLSAVFMKLLIFDPLLTFRVCFAKNNYLLARKRRNKYLSYIHLGSSVCHPVCHPVCRPVVVAER